MGFCCGNNLSGSTNAKMFYLGTINVAISHYLGEFVHAYDVIEFNDDDGTVEQIKQIRGHSNSCW